MTKTTKKTIEQFDIFVANKIYPSAKEIFSSQTQSIESIKDDCVVVLDNNVLLLPYGTRPESLNEIGITYEKLILDNRLIIPGQVAREFAKNRPMKLTDLFKDISNKANINISQKGKYPLLESLDAYKRLTEIEREIDEKFKEYRKTIKELANHIQGWIWNDPVSLLYAKLFQDDVIFELDFDKEKIAEDLNFRKAHSIPPGYKDAGKDDKGIGDLLIWHTILELGKRDKKNVLFVTGDNKPDWFHQSNKQPLYPRFELVDEFRRISEGGTFHIVSFSGFLDLFGVDANVVQEVRLQEDVNTLATRVPSDHPKEVLERLKYYLGSPPIDSSALNWISINFPLWSLEHSTDKDVNLVLRRGKNEIDVCSIEITNATESQLKLLNALILSNGNTAVLTRRRRLLLVITTAEIASKLFALFLDKDISYENMDLVIGYIDVNHKFQAVSFDDY